MSSVGWASVFSLTLLAACGTRASGGFDPDGGTGGGSGDASAGPGDDASLGAGGGGPAADAGACPNVDILFVIDNSGSMADKQTRLASSFPGFATAIVNRLPAAKSVHVGVVSTSEYYAGAPQACLVRRTEGPLSSNRPCQSTPFLGSADPGFKDTFSCTAQLGSGGDDDEKPIRGLLGALDPANNASGQCNESFSREDALLIAVIITDEDDVREADCNPQNFTGTCGSGGTPAEWHDKIVALKGGHPENAVVLTLLSLTSGGCSNTLTVNLLEFTHLFGTKGFVGDVCATSYDAFFDGALPTIDRACVEFVPPR